MTASSVDNDSRQAGAGVATLRLEATVTLKQKLEIGWNEDAPFRKDGLPDDQVPRAGDPAGPGRSAEIALACADKHIMPTADDRDDAARKGTTINTDRDDQL